MQSSAIYVFIPFVFDAATAPAAAVKPAYQRAALARPIPPRVAELLTLLHTFIAYGKNLADILQRHAAAPHRLPWFWFVARAFGSIEIQRILVRITRGLLRAAALEAKLRRIAARGRDLRVASTRRPSPCKPRAAKPATRTAKTAKLAKDPWRLPSPEEVEAEVRRRPVGAVLIDICRDLGIESQQMDQAARRQLWDAVPMYGGNLVRLLFPKKDELYNPNFPPIPDPFVFPPWPAASPQPPSPTQPLAPVPTTCPPPPAETDLLRTGVDPPPEPSPEPPRRHQAEPRAPSELVGFPRALLASTALTSPSPEARSVIAPTLMESFPHQREPKAPSDLWRRNRSSPPWPAA